MSEELCTLNTEHPLQWELRETASPDLCGNSQC